MTRGAASGYTRNQELVPLRFLALTSPLEFHDRNSAAMFVAHGFRCAAIAVMLITLPCTLVAEEKFPLGDDLRLLESDTQSQEYAALLAQMNGPDLDAEWRRVETRDSAAAFAKQQGGLEKVMADPALQAAYERRAKIREDYLNLIRGVYAQRKQTAPFDKGQVAMAAGTVRGSEVPALDLAIVLPSPGAEKQWPRFRGPTGQGIAVGDASTQWPTTWSDTENIAWKATLPGDGNSSPVIWNDRIFLTTAGAAGSQRSLHALDTKNGAIVWTYELPEHAIEPDVRDKNGFASATPVTDGERVITYFGSGGLICCDMQGKLLWKYDTSNFNSLWGSGASPLLYENLVILVHDQNRGASLAFALDKVTGERVWSIERPKAMGWSTPTIVRMKERDELLYAGGEMLTAYEPRTGKQLWSLAGPTKEVVPTIVIGERLIYSASGRQGPTLAVRPGGTGDVSETHLAWTAVRGGPHVPSPVLFDNKLFVVNDFGIATCVDALTGEFVWQERIRDKFSASGVLLGDTIYFPSETGVTYLIRASGKYELVGKNTLPDPILASPAAINGRIYMRSGRVLYAIEQPQ